jgi:hypothetical protein
LLMRITVLFTTCLKWSGSIPCRVLDHPQENPYIRNGF